MADGMYSMSDADFLAMAQALSGTIASSPTTYGLTLPFSTQLDGEVANFQQELTAHVDKQAQAKAQAAKGRHRQRGARLGLHRLGVRPP